MKLDNVVEERAWPKFAAAALGGMLASAPLVDRMHVSEQKWAEKAGKFADALLEEFRDRSRT